MSRSHRPPATTAQGPRAPSQKPRRPQLRAPARVTADSRPVSKKRRHRLGAEEDDDEDVDDDDDEALLGGATLRSCIEGEGEPPHELLLAAVACAASGSVRGIPVQRLREDDAIGSLNLRNSGLGVISAGLLALMLPVTTSVRSLWCVRGTKPFSACFSGAAPYSARFLVRAH